MKKKNYKAIKLLLSLVAAVTVIFSAGVNSYAEEPISDDFITESGETDVILPEETVTGGENSINIFDEIYRVLEENADKIFSILAFVGTLVVGVGYKSGLLPLLRDALSKLKSSIDGVKADGEQSKALTEIKMAEIGEQIKDINAAIEKNNGELARIEWQFDSYEELMAERKSMKALLVGQIDMLYAIFMSSALPQYQKDEIGTKIQEMREELASYEQKVEK